MAKTETWNLLEDLNEVSKQIVIMNSAPIQMTDGVLNAAGMRLMEAIVNNPGANMSQLSNILAVTKGATSQLTIKLEESGLVERKNTVGRDTQLVLTKKAKRIYNKKMKERQELGEAMLASFGDIPEETLNALHDLLLRSKKYLEEARKA